MKTIKNNRNSGGFWLCFLLNLAARAEMFTLALFALVAHFLFGLTIWVFVSMSAIWLIVSLLVTMVLNFVASGLYEENARPNKNPYSAKNDDREQ